MMIPPVLARGLGQARARPNIRGQCQPCRVAHEGLPQPTPDTVEVSGSQEV